MAPCSLIIQLINVLKGTRITLTVINLELNKLYDDHFYMGVPPTHTHTHTTVEPGLELAGVLFVEEN